MPFTARVSQLDTFEETLPPLKQIRLTNCNVTIRIPIALRCFFRKA